MPKNITCPKCNSTEVAQLDCATCSGTGSDINDIEPCETCEGMGVVEDKLECLDCGYEFDE